MACYLPLEALTPRLSSIAVIYVDSTLYGASQQTAARQESMRFLQEKEECVRIVPQPSLVLITLQFGVMSL
jgi:hypothetical protein